MALQSRIVNGSLTEIYAGGGNFVTEAFPTNFHTFAPKRILLNGQSADDYKEVTPAERSAIEAADAKWIEPSQTFIDLWDAACRGFGSYNEKTGYFELNGLVDITYAEAMDIYQANQQISRGSLNSLFTGLSHLRTNIPFGANWAGAATNTFKNCTNIEVINFWPVVSSLTGAFCGCTKLRKIIGPVGVGDCNAAIAKDVFVNCRNLETLQLRLLHVNADLSELPKLSAESLAYIIENRSPFNSKAITITVHPDVYAKLTDEANAEWHALLAAAAEKNITFATT